MEFESTHADFISQQTDRFTFWPRRCFPSRLPDVFLFRFCPSVSREPPRNESRMLWSQEWARLSPYLRHIVRVLCVTWPSGAVYHGRIRLISNTVT